MAGHSAGSTAVTWHWKSAAALVSWPSDVLGFLAGACEGSAAPSVGGSLSLSGHGASSGVLFLFPATCGVSGVQHRGLPCPSHCFFSGGESASGCSRFLFAMTRSALRCQLSCPGVHPDSHVSPIDLFILGPCPLVR